MTVNPNIDLDTSQVEDYRGARFGKGAAIGGGAGGLGVLLVLLVMFLGGGSSSDLGDLSQLLGGDVAGAGDVGSASTQLATTCKTGADASTSDACRLVAYIDSIQKYWTGEFAANGKTYVLSKTRFFDGSMPTGGCGEASREVGPFYCPADKYVYIDLGFFEDLKTKFGAKGGPFAQAYVLAHEYGHHVQDLLGVLDTGSGQEGAKGQSVRTELQADCYAGVWADHAVETGYLLKLTDTDIADGLDAAASVGDDRIQQEYQGKVTPESWTHGSSAQRQHWFTVGYQTGDPARCDTFSGDI
jgi:predicted metalloprotease